MMKIKLKTVMAGPRGNHGIGCVLTVGKEIDKKSADHLLKTGQAEKVESANAKAEKVDAPKEKATEKVDTPDAPKEEAPSRKSTGKKPRGR